jgi:hypothetical protein
MAEHRAQLISWIVAAVLVLLALGAYVVWTTRPRAQYSARSLTAAPSKAVTKSLHVEGCDRDFIVQPGELVEPRAVPGAPVGAFRDIYGKEAARDRQDLIWKPPAFTLTDGENDAQNPFVHVSLNTGHVVETLDGIELGIDSFGAIYRKARDRKIELHERIESDATNWTLTVSFFSSCGRKFRSEYTRSLPRGPEIDRQIAARPTGNSSNGSGSQSGPALLRSDVFMNKIVGEYTLTPSNGRDDSAHGSSSEHD